MEHGTNVSRNEQQFSALPEVVTRDSLPAELETIDTKVVIRNSIPVELEAVDTKVVTRDSIPVELEAVDTEVFTLKDPRVRVKSQTSEYSVNPLPEYLPQPEDEYKVTELSPALGDPVSVSRGKRDRYFGSRRTTLLIIILAIALVVIIIGLAVPLSSRHHKNASELSEISATSSPSSSTTSQTIKPSPTSASSSSSTETPVSYQAISAATCENNGPNIVITTQTSNGSLYMTASWQYSEWMNSWISLDVNPTPRTNTPLSSLCYIYQDNIYIRIYYLSENSSLAEISMACYPDGECDGHTSKDLGFRLSSTSGIAAGWLFNRGINVYALDDSAVLNEIQYRGNSWASPSSMGFQADQDSAIAAAFANPDLTDAAEQIRVFWKGPSGDLQTVGSEAGSWDNMQSLLVGTDNLTSTAAILTASQKAAALFSLPGSIPYMYELSGGNFVDTDTQGWLTNQTDRIPGPIAAVSWGNASIRLYYNVGNVIQEFANEGRGWWSTQQLDSP